jgi:uncharacterized protein YceH (UPF0502 family)
MDPTDSGEKIQLSTLQRRILGVLIEKQKTTPDVYPMSVHALVAGCNQKSNRDPLLNVDAVEIETTLEELQKLNLASRVDTGRVEKWRHHVYEQWQVSKEEIAVLAELLLRGAQTEGELRARCSRMEPFPDRESLRAVIGPLVQRGLAIWLTPEGRRGALLTHGFHDPAELEGLRARHSDGVESHSTAATASSSKQLQEIQDQIGELREQVAQLRLQLESLQAGRQNPAAMPSP